jgi:hypothetical protein
MSIRLRLTLLYTVILALTLAGFGAMLYSIQSQSIRGGEERMLSDWAQRTVEHRQRGGDLPRGLQPPPGPPLLTWEEGPWPRRACPLS